MMNKNQLDDVRHILFRFFVFFQNNFQIFFFLFSDVIMSTIGALLWAIGLGVWITIFQTNRIAWGEFADNISFVIPLGTA